MNSTDHRPEILLLACNDPTSASGLGTRLRTTIDGLAKVGAVDVVAFGGGAIAEATNGAGDFITSRTREYATRDRRPIPTSLAGYFRWSSQFDRPRVLSFANYASERRSISDQLNRGYDLIWCASPRAFILLGGTHSGALVTDLSQNEAERDLDILMTSGRRKRMVERPVHAARVALATLDRRRWNRLYAHICDTSTAATICSELDRDRVGAPRLVVVPNSYPAPPLKSTPYCGGVPTITFAGFYSYEPNAAAAASLASEILPRVRTQVPSASLRLVGEPTPRIDRLRSLPGVTVTGFVPDISTEMNLATLVAAPVQAVAGTNVKIIEAFAYGVPVVCSSAAANGLGVTGQRALLIGDDHDSFARACVALLTDAARRREQVARATEIYEAIFRTEAVSDRVAQVAARAIETVRGR